LTGPEFGLFADNNEPLFDRISRQTTSTSSSSSTATVTGTGTEMKRGKRTAVCDTSNARSGYASKATTVIKCESDDGVVDAIVDQVEGHDLVFGRLMDLASVQGCEYELFSLLV
jgi:RNA exonuclease 1